MTAKELYNTIHQPIKILIVYKSDEWRDMMWNELWHTPGLDSFEGEYLIDALVNGHYQYTFCHVNSLSSKHMSDYVITEAGIPQWKTQPYLISHFFHDNKTISMVEEGD